MVLIYWYMVIVLAASGLIFIAGMTERGANFGHDRTVGPKGIARMVIKQGGVHRVGFCRCAPQQNVRLELRGGFETVASIYDRGGPAPRPGMIFVHGNTWLGRNLSTYRVLASLLADHGFIVLTFDQSGFGEFDDPFERGPAAVAAAYDGLAAIRVAFDYLVQHTSVDPRRISIFGHSGGIDLAIAFGLTTPQIASVLIMIAPPGGSGVPESREYKQNRQRYFSRRFEDTYRFVYGREIPDWFSWELTKINDFYEDYAKIEPLLRSPGHKPILLLLAENDQPSGHPHVKRRFEEWTEPKKLLELQHSDHYLNTAQSRGLVFYDRAVTRQLREQLIPWVSAVTNDSILDS